MEFILFYFFLRRVCTFYVNKGPETLTAGVNRIILCRGLGYQTYLQETSSVDPEPQLSDRSKCERKEIPLQNGLSFHFVRPRQLRYLFLLH